MPKDIIIFIQSKNIFLMCTNLKALIFDKYIDKNNFADVCYEDDEESDIQNMIEENKKKQNYLSNWIDYSG